MLKNTILIAIIVAVIFAGGGFFAGMQYQKSQRPNFQFGGANGQFGNRRFGGAGGAGGPGARGGAVIGEILSSDASSITVKLPDGSSKIVLISNSTTINKAATGTKDDLKTGERVAVFGTTNSDGSVTAQNVQLNPMMRIGGQSQGQGGTPAARPTGTSTDY